jgi:sporulation protein YlmC with PRC-barrel domain
LGTLRDLVFDLESGRLLYGIVDEAGLGVGARDNYAVAPGAFRRVNETDKVIIAEFGTKKLGDAPNVPRNRDEYTSPTFIGNVYRFYGEQPWWTDRSPEPTGRNAAVGRFGNVHRASDMLGMQIQNVNGEDLGRVHNVMVDLPDGRIGYVLLAPRTAGRDADGFIALPPMAVTVGNEGKTLVTNLEGDKLQTAPRVTRNELNKLDDAGFAANVYRFHGKDAWWRGTATGRD